MCSYVYGTFLTKFQPECSYSTCSFMRVFTVFLFTVPVIILIKVVCDFQSRLQISIK